MVLYHKEVWNYAIKDEDTPSHEKETKGLLTNVLRYFPIVPRLKRLSIRDHDAKKLQMKEKVMDNLTSC